MADKPHKSVNLASQTVEQIRLDWEPLKKGDKGTPYAVKGYKHLTFHVNGIISGGIEIQGSIIDKKYDPIVDSAGLPLTFGTNGIRSSENDVLEIQPVMVGGDENEEILVSMIARK